MLCLGWFIVCNNSTIMAQAQGAFLIRLENFFWIEGLANSIRV